MQSITFSPVGADPQQQFDVAVVIPTVLRPKLIPAAQSVFTQKGVGRIQLLIGIDKPLGSPSIIERVRALCPAHCAVTVVDLGYSTSDRHGGPHQAHDGGALRSLLTMAANSRHHVRKPCTRATTRRPSSSEPVRPARSAASCS